MKAHCIMHVPFEGPGFIEDWFESRDIKLRYWKLYEDIELPKVKEVDFLLIMGGPMNIYEYTRFPYFKDEKKIIAACIRENKKVLGICLGAQLIADVLGQKVFSNTEKEIGWFPVSGSWDLIPDPFIPFHWHGETFELPEGAIHLAKSEVCRNQAFTFGNNVLALQFHIELTPTLIEGLIKNAGRDLSPGSWVQSKEEIRKGLSNVQANREILFTMMEEFTFELNI